MEGLEISEVSVQEAATGTKSFRLDAEYFWEQYLKIELDIERHETRKLKDVTTKIDVGHVGPMLQHYRDEGIPLLQTKNIHAFFLNGTDLIRITEEFHKELRKSQLEKYDILIARSGSFGKASINLSDEPRNSSDIIIIQADKKLVNPFYLTAFLNSYHGSQQMIRFSSGGLQGHVNLTILEELTVVIPSKAFQVRLETLLRSANDLRSKAELFHEQAKHVLLNALCLEDWLPATPLTYEANASEAFLSDRLDAEFFQPRIKELYQLLGNKAQCIRDVSDLRQDRFNGTKNPFNYLEIGAVSTDGIISDYIIDGDEAPSRATWHVERGDVLTSTVRPIRGLTAIIEDSQHGSVASSGFAVLTPKGISPELLLCYLKLPQICELMDLHTSASMYPAISVSDILGLPFKHPGKEAEEKIVSLIQEARAKRAHSKSLLERAKRAVEIAIEESEETALAYLDGKHYLADELLPKLFSPNRHYIDLATVQHTIEAESLVYVDTTINRYLHEWTREGRIHDAGRGWYSNLPHAFHPNRETPPLPELEKLLRKHFPLLEYTVWSTRQLTTFFHHYAARHATFLMVERDAMDTVADVLLKAGHQVVIHPLGDTAKNFALTQDETIILRPRLSSDHKETCASIEQMLVDLHHEIQKLGLFDLGEFQSVFENLSNRYRLNIPALKRYAERRKIDSTELLKLGNII